MGGNAILPKNTSISLRRMKFFAHPDVNEFVRQEVRPAFARVVVEKPKESRKGTLTGAWEQRLTKKNRVKRIWSALDSRAWA